MVEICICTCRPPRCSTSWCLRASDGNDAKRLQFMIRGKKWSGWLNNCTKFRYVRFAKIYKKLRIKISVSQFHSSSSRVGQKSVLTKFQVVLCIFERYNCSNYMQMWNNGTFPSGYLTVPIIISKVPKNGYLDKILARVISKKHSFRSNWFLVNWENYLYFAIHPPRNLKFRMGFNCHKAVKMKFLS